MRSSLLAIVLTAATVPFTFAAQTPAPGTNPPAKAQKVHKTKKHHKKAAKAPKTAAAKTATNAALPHQK